MKTRLIFFLCIFPLAYCELTRAQGKPEDYKRAEELNGLIQKKIYYAPADVRYLKERGQYAYSVITPTGTVYKRLDAKTFAVTEGQPSPPENTGAGSGRGSGGTNGRSPDGKWTAFVKNYNVYVRATDGDAEFALSTDGTKDDYYTGYLVWSPNSRNLATYKVHPGQEHKIYFVESSPGTQLQPILRSRDYQKPGDSVEQKTPALFDVGARKQVPVDAGKIRNQYFLTNIAWRNDSRAFTFEYNQRGHQVYSVVEVDVKGQLRELVKEQAKTFFVYYYKRFRFDVNDGKETIWMSERDGWNHLYLYDANGNVKNQVTKGNWVVRSVVKVNEQDRTVIFEGSGMDAKQDPYFIQYYKIGFDGTGLVKLTTENGNHKAVFADDYSTFVDTYSRVDQPQVTVLRDGKSGKVLKQLEQADITDLLKTGWKLPEVFSAKGRDGKTDIWGIVVRPSNFDPAKKYPVIEYIYAGPHDSFVPKSFVNDSRGSLHELAELGFVVVQCDGMGTSNRSKAFHDVCWKNLKDAGFPDRMAWIRALAGRYSYLDTTRVGIFGNSAGGQSSLGGLLFHPEFYKVAVSSSGCHDNRMDKIWWNEQWMGYPIGPQYAESSNVDNAWRLQGKLLLILGELDDNVDPASTMQVINQLVKHNKNFDFLFVPGMKHSLGGDYGEHKRRDFFVKHLLGVEPPEWTWTPKITVPKP
ncbi:S9 family peptidase [Hufsiella ginkgonis]|uniref:Prolyl oligopeptidase family serine peptidase n=1 Tax=Hufsiella ginkgonis TaxID=2695274 RepID=A0A7K1Y1L8_9SPHI|nr:S9 family peptidase [Hufsiella ginkgonis]MXV16576.1 prolyl oligopeptidase family serine peptidase [Hufsiella ginkgonis]